MKPWRAVGRALASGTVTVLLIVLAPAVLLFGELVNRHYLRGLPPGRDRILVRRRGLPGRRGRVVVRQGRLAAEGPAGTYLKASLGTSSISRMV